MSFGLEMRRYPRRIDRRVREAAEILGITDLLQRRPKALSGGQRQRVAVGRAIVRKPKVFLFDEPLSNLDAKLRVLMRAEISKLHQRLQSTMIYVTHDQVEAMTMGDRIVVMLDGVIQQVDAPLDLYHRPANRFVATFIGSPPMNIFEGAIQAERAGACFRAREQAFRLHLPDAAQAALAPTSTHRLARIRPDFAEQVSQSTFGRDPRSPGRGYRAHGRGNLPLPQPRRADHYRPRRPLRSPRSAPITTRREPGSPAFFDPATEAAIR